MRPDLTRVSALCVLFLLSSVLEIRAELPLPQATIYGRITTPNGAPVAMGSILAQVRRGGATLSFPGEIKVTNGESWYVVRISMETSIGAPGPSGSAAREGDAVVSLLLDGAPVTPSAPLATAVSGSVRRIDVTGEGGSSDLFYARGDCSADGSVDISDPVRLLNYLFVGSAVPSCLEACDGDASGVLNITDAVVVLEYLFLGGSEPPSPGPTCGVDATPSTLGCVTSSCI
ncbi:MAG TPA: dockerin type I repeat-containing protein [Planctomycetota bacterium]|nr:dockerin type I repeat-containing protein [Planctomycetota bacterium]